MADDEIPKDIADKIKKAAKVDKKAEPGKGAKLGKQARAQRRNGHGDNKKGGRGRG
jgi:hypothetical protein